MVFVSDKYHNKPEMVASRQLIDMAGIKYRWEFETNPSVVFNPSSIQISDVHLCISCSTMYF